MGTDSKADAVQEALNLRLAALQKYDLSPRLARWLRGSTAEELDADAKLFREQLSGGSWTTPVTL